MDRPYSCIIFRSLRAIAQSGTSRGDDRPDRGDAPARPFCPGLYCLPDHPAGQLVSDRDLATRPVATSLRHRHRHSTAPLRRRCTSVAVGNYRLSAIPDTEPALSPGRWALQRAVQPWAPGQFPFHLDGVGDLFREHDLEESLGMAAGGKLRGFPKTLFSSQQDRIFHQFRHTSCSQALMRPEGLLF